MAQVEAEATDQVEGDMENPTRVAMVPLKSPPNPDRKSVV